MVSSENQFTHLPNTMQLQVVHDLGLNVGGFNDFLASLNNQGFLLQKGARSYQLRTSDY